MPAIRVVSIIEAAFVTGPAKNLIEFGRRARENAPDGTKVDGSTVDLSFIAYQRGAEREPNAFVTAARAAGLTVDLVRESGRFDTSALAQLRHLIDNRRPDIIQTHNVKSHFLMRVSKLGRRYRWLAFHHGYTTTDLKMRAYNQLDRWSLRAPDHIIAVCSAFAQQLQDKGVASNRITVRHNAIVPFAVPDPEAVAAVRASIPAAPGTPIILSVGRLSLEKGHIDLIHALDHLRGTLGEDRFHLVIAGEGPEREKIEAARDRLGLAAHVTLAGLQHRIAPYYAMADVVAMPSHSEGSPNALLEAMAAALPIVATRVGGIPEIVTHQETALLVESGDVTQMARSIQILLQDREQSERLAQNAERVAQSYSPDAYRQALTRVYQSLLNR
jgi:glycosyltransferase involved in cell wall biosynthesis